MQTSLRQAQPKKTIAEVEAMREGGKILATILAGVKKIVKPGMTEIEAASWVEKEIKVHGAIATYKTSEVNFPAVICVSTNEQIVHSVPTNYVFEKGDVVKFDLVITFKGMQVDSAFTMVVGEEPTGARKHLLNTTERSLYAGIDAIKGVVHVGDISAAIEKVLNDGKLGIIRELVGHGIGKQMWLPPEIPNYGTKGIGPILSIGDTIAIEPMATLGGDAIILEPDGWTYSTRDGSLSAHFEHTVLVTERGTEILTMI